jgi:hypothetical protein
MTSKIKVDNINKVSDDSNIIKKCGTTITLGASGDSIALASGASQTGFGRTGTVDWQTTPKTGDFTAANGEGYFVNTTSGAVTMTMPSGSAGAIVSIQDYNKTFDSNNLTIAPASGEIMNGGAASANLIISTEGQGLTFVYVDGTVGWKTVHENEFTAGGSNFIVATGGTITTSGDCKIHTFTGPGTFAVCAISNCATNNILSHLVVAGGAGGGWDRAGGGGAGGFREVKSPVTPYTASPLDGYPSAPNRVTATAASFPITVGAGGAGGTDGPQKQGVSGSNSIFSTVTSAGGGGGGSAPGPTNGADGGSGGGTSGPSSSAGSGNTPPVSPSQGFPGGIAPAPGGSDHGAGGGGATAAGGPGAGSLNPGTASAGGAGATTSINGTPTARAGGGGGGFSDGAPGCSPFPGGAAGAGGGGAGGSYPGGLGSAGTVNTGGGGGGGSNGPNTSPAGNGGAGGSGIVVIRYKFQ